MRCNIAYIIGDNGYLRILDFGVTCIPSNLPVSYAPSLVKITQGQELSVIEEKKRSRLSASLFTVRYLFLSSSSSRSFLLFSFEQDWSIMFFFINIFISYD
ncbi:hypothetical protein AtNW77_Chr1g0068101 [Arabidopsis thaliana]